MSLTNASDRKKFLPFFQKVMNWTCYLIFLFTIAEVSAKYALDIYRKSRSDSTDFGSMERSLAQELSLVQAQAKLSQYRWYQNLENFQGVNVITDASGFRIDNRALDNRIKVGMFGGSTTFSVLTDQNGTIAEHISRQSDVYQVLNFGVGGYSSSAEIMTLVESLRAYPTLKMAFFYDGINELGRAQDGAIKGLKSNESEFLLGTPYLDGVRAGIINSNGFGFSWNQSNLFYIYNRLLRPSQTTFANQDFLTNTKERYFANVRVINAICSEYKIKCFFIIQPSVFSAKETVLHKAELNILKNELYGKSYPQLTELILSDRRSKLFDVVDATAALNNKTNKDRIFYDWHHLNSLGNYYIASQIKLEIDRRIEKGI